MEKLTKEQVAVCRAAAKLPFKNADFELKHIKALVKYAKDHQKSRDQWVRSKHYAIAAEHDAKLTVIVEMMENIVVFHVGDGVLGFSTQGTLDSIDARLASFVEMVR